MNRLKRLSTAALTVIVLLTLSACGGKGTFTITLTNGAVLEARMDDASDYNLYFSDVNTLVVKEQDEPIVEGRIINAGYFESMLAQIPDMDGATVLNQSDTSCTYRYEEDGHVTTAILRKVPDSELAILWAGEQSPEKAEDAVDHVLIAEIQK